VLVLGLAVAVAAWRRRRGAEAEPPLDADEEKALRRLVSDGDSNITES
jgi:cytochrome c-type biogenesis protein CcmH/NrfF